ncbi:MAG: hypothetical protein RDU89_04835 [bacterium]|nr:hypothetical protein [bacterium]
MPASSPPLTGGVDKELKALFRVRVIISSGALVIVLAHLIWPAVVVDAATITLFVIAILPWVAPLVKSIKLPSGLTIKLRELQGLTASAQAAGLLSPAPSLPRRSPRTPPPQAVQEERSLQSVARRVTPALRWPVWPMRLRSGSC